MYERMLDKQHEPTDEEFIEYCGESKDYFIDLDRFLTDELKTDKLMRFPYGNSYGWGYKYYIKSKLICDVFAENNAFTVMLRLPNDKFKKLYDEVSEYTKNLIDNKYPCGDAGWIHCRVIDENILSDIKKLLSAKVNK